MGLDEYRRRRDFRRTPEPAGDERPEAGEGRRFVVQKHSARRLHYDFRLEIGGVLKSWAVPKGPSPDPHEKRLAVETEDHPLDYGEFEGVIPKGEYGAGAVLLWDRGTWRSEGDPQTAYRRGHLRFHLEGEKLRGRWSLVRTGGRDSSNWLLIKSDDEYAGVGWSPIEENSSVASGRTLEQVAGAPARLWHADSGREELLPAIPGTPAPQPETMDAQLAYLTDRPPTGADWLHEIKFDGYRILARVADGEVRLFSRNGKDWTARFPAIARQLADLPIRSAWFDGEICALLPDGRTTFQGLQEALSEKRDQALIYFLFDLMYLEGNDLRECPLNERKATLGRLLATVGTAAPLRYTDHIVGHGDTFFEQACAHALEGTLAKRGDSAYRAGRGREWQKIKCLLQQEFVIGGYTDPSGGRKGLGALLLGVYEGADLRYAGKVGTGFTQATLTDLYARLQPLEQNESPFSLASPRKVPGIHWVRPELVAEIQFAEWTRDGVLRTPSYQGLREDKPPAEVRREAPDRPSEPPPAGAGRWKLSNPEKVLFPEQGVTKRDLAQYYESVADWVLPDLIGRPLTLFRCPEGRHKGCFFQKHAEASIPGAIRRVAIPEKAGEEIYLYIDDLEGLIGLVQMGVLEMHTWGARAERVENPDRVVFDLDPDEGLPWTAVIEAAEAIRERLAQFGLTAFLRTTGGKGLHVVAPILPEAGWDEVKGFAKAVADGLVHEAPHRYTASPSKRARQGKLFIDYLRNTRGATAITNYGTRAKPGAPVATPIAWEELDGSLRADRWNIANIAARLDALSEDPWQAYPTLRQRLPTR